MANKGADNNSITLINLRELVDVEALQQIQDRFSKVTGFGAVISDHMGNPLTEYSMFSPICQIIRSHPEGARRCQQCDAFLGRQTVENEALSTHYCHAGLIDLAAPIVVNGNYLGAVLCGQVLCDSYDKDNSAQRFHKCVEELELDAEQMNGFYEELSTVSIEKLADVAELLQVIASHVAELGINRINQMLLNEINLAIVEEQKTRSQLEQSLKLSELKSLESTVNPHFMFNALNTIARLALMESAPQTEEMAYTLAELLRHNLRRVGTCVPFREELEYCNKYLQIQKVRFGDRFEITQNVTEEAMTALVPAMTLQPLIENALIHGLKDYSDGGRVRIDAKVTDEVFVLQVEDNGEGIEEDKLAALKEMLNKKGIADNQAIWMGLSNVCKQFHYFTDSNCAMDITSLRGKGTTVTITAFQPAMIAKGIHTNA